MLPDISTFWVGVSPDTMATLKNRTDEKDRQMSKRKAIVLAVFTAWPLVYLLLFVCTIFAMILLDSSGSQHASGPPTIVLIIVPLHFLTMLEILILMVIYIRHVFKTDRVPQDKKALWAAVLLLGNMIAMPIYWYLYIWKGSNDGQASH